MIKQTKSFRTRTIVIVFVVASLAVTKVSPVTKVFITITSNLVLALTGLFVVGLSFLSYKGWVSVKWMEMENATKATMSNVAGQVGHALNNTASQL